MLRSQTPHSCVCNTLIEPTTLYRCACRLPLTLKRDGHAAGHNDSRALADFCKAVPPNADAYQMRAKLNEWTWADAR